MSLLQNDTGFPLTGGQCDALSPTKTVKRGKSAHVLPYDGPHSTRISFASVAVT
jgi:hypothetical protein